MKDKLKKIISDKRILIGFYILFAVIASLQSLKGTKSFEEGGIEYTKYNNYTIFEKSFEHLENNQDLYILYPEEHWDLYKYTPSFSAFFGLFNALPDWLGLTLWNLMNALVLLFAIYYLPRLNLYQKGLICLIVLLELLTSMQNAQSNGLIAGLLVLAFGLMERNKAFWAMLCIVFSMYIKLFGIVGFALVLFYPKQWKTAIYALFWTGIFFVLPLLFVGLDQYLNLFKSYLGLLADDHDASYGYSVMGWLQTWFSLDFNKNLIVGLGILLFLLPFYRIKFYKDYVFKYFVLCSVLLWIVIFNHKAESPTFIIAMTGVALWYLQGQKSTLNSILFISAIVLTSLSPTDLFPRSIREDFVKPYVLKAVPCILIWFKLIYDMIVLKKEELPAGENN